MNNSMTNAVLLVLAVLVTDVDPAPGQEWAGLQNTMIKTEYVSPSNASNYPTYELLKNRKVLEELTAFLSPLSLPRPLQISMKECGVPNSWYSPTSGVELCYELPAYIARRAHGIEPPEGVSRQDIVVGAFVEVALHEVGHAIFDLLAVPILGRQEDAADQVSAFVMLNFGKDFGRRMLAGSAQFWPTIDVPLLPSAAFADEHGTPLQRFYNFLCIAYGGQPDTFGDFVEKGVLPKERAVHCGREYEQAQFAFAKTILPHVNEALLKKVQAIQWAKWESPTLIDGVNVFFRGIIRSYLVWIFVGVFVLASTLSGSPKVLFRHLNVFRRHGRIDRRHWWAYMLGALAVINFTSFILRLLNGFDLPLVQHNAIDVLLGLMIVLWMYWGAVFVIERLHDRNKRGWWLLIWLVPVIGPLWILIEAGFLRGTGGMNRFGPQYRAVAGG